MAHAIRNRKALVARVRRIGGQVASLERSLEAGTDCGAILQHVASIRGAVQGLMNRLLEEHLREHVAEDPRSARELEPVLSVLKSYLR